MAKDDVIEVEGKVVDTCLLYTSVLEVPASNIKKGIAEILKREGFVKNVEFIEDDKQGIIRVFLKYGQNGEKVITNLKRVSKPCLLYTSRCV